MTINWVTIIPPVITGVVGVVGISGTILAAKITAKTQSANLKLNIDAENFRAGQAEKRRVYATFMASYNQALSAAVKCRASFRLAGNTNEIKATETIQHEALGALNGARAEMGLIEPVTFGSLPDQLVDALVVYAEGTAHGARDLDKPKSAVELAVQDELYVAMRADLAKPFQ